jgi:hypothetical protein
MSYRYKYRCLLPVITDRPGSQSIHGSGGWAASWAASSNGGIRATCGGADGRDGGCGAANDGGWKAGGSRSTCGGGNSSSNYDS